MAFGSRLVEVISLLELTRQSLRAWRSEQAGIALGFAGLLAVLFMIGTDPTQLRGVASPLGERIASNTTRSGPLPVYVPDLYQFGWTLVVGVYIAARVATATARDIGDGTLELLLTAPISRTRVLRARLFAMVFGFVGMTVFVGTVFVALSVLTETTIDPIVVWMIHALPVPFFLLCIVLGLFVGTITDRGRLAGLASGLLVLGVFAIGQLSPGSPLELISPLYYYDPVAIMHGTSVTAQQIGVPIVVALIVGGLSRLRFNRLDLS
ncbi:ABC transporter permease subunit [Halocatena halophila]|uniref:ABC transporter permease subunit n=1 Tax=Halocatena halophila TaxID=2814576 RepID=UPI002ED4D34A